MRGLIAICAVFGAMLPMIAAAAALPAESEIPGERPTEAELPAESALPSYVASLGTLQPVAEVVDDDAQEANTAADGAPANGDEAANDDAELEPQPDAGQQTDAPPADPPARDVPPPKLPSEQMIPQSADAAGSAAGVGDVEDALPIKGSPDGIPWLRLNLRGHTAPLRAVTFTDDGQRICTAGEDKTLVVWAASPGAIGAPPKWGYERSVRWQVQRGTRGRIYALAASPEAVAMAGEGAMGGSGEILLVDAKTGELAATLNDLDRGHRQVVVALSFAPPATGKSLASLSMDGCLVQWRPTPEGLWRATRLSDPDSAAAAGDQVLVRRLLAGRTVSSVAALDDNFVVAPAYSRLENNRVVWRLELYDQAASTHRPLGDERQAPHWDRVMALAVSGDGSRMASADGGGYVYLWDLRSTPAQVRVLARTQAWSLAFDKSGSRLAIGGDAGADSAPSRVEVWNVTNFAAPQRIAQQATVGLVAACGLSPDGETLTWTAGARAFVRPVSGGAAQELPAGVSPPMRVAFPAEQPFHHLGIAKAAAGGRADGVNLVFDTDLLRLDRINQPAPARWLPEDWLSRGWTVREEGAVAGLRSIWLQQGGARRSRLPLTEERHGRLSASCWIPSRQAEGPPTAAAVGTSGGGIYLVQPTAEGETPIVRQFRGHTAAVTSLAVSRDLRYLASSSMDGTVCVWPLTDLVDDPPVIQRWGSTFESRDGALYAQGVRPDGPVYFRGLREGDQMVEIRYVDPTGALRVVRNPDEIRGALERVPWETLMTFRYSRGRDAAAEFQIYPAWQQLASLFVADDGEWAYWHPTGYYDASFEGHKLFGWQINRGLEMLPDFFLAAQFRRQLERPEVMSQLLRRGNLEAAFRSADVPSPASPEDAIVNSYRLKPEIEIKSPADGAVVSGRAKLTAVVSVDVAERLAPPKAFANGVVAVERRLVAETVADGRRSATYEWELRLPSDQRVMLQVAAATENEVTADAAVVVTNEPSQTAAASRLFLLSIGIDQYQDAQIPRLSTAVRSTEDLSALFQSRALELYRIDAASLLDQRATKPAWHWLTADLAARLARHVNPDDVVLVSLSGHGVQALGEAGYQFVTADARYADVMAGRYANCLSLADLAFLADVPCRKLVILNTCHGGADQPLQHRELKSAVRALHGDLMLTLAASGGEEEAVEGRFANRLLEALDGAADADSDGVVSFAETVAYVEHTVAADSLGDSVQQAPTAGPKELLPYARIPLTKVPPPHVTLK